MTGLPSKPPIILAGPVVRRATADRVHVWLATSQDLKLDVEIYKIADPTARSPALSAPISTRGPAQTTPLQLGEKLWIHLFDVVPIDAASGKGKFPIDTILAYDVMEDGGKRRLRELAKLSDLVIEPFPLPTFVLPGPKASARILYASCRKFHGDGDDAMLATEELLKRNAKDPAKRAATLLLTGDQIYADDVADLLAQPINEWATRLIGRAEDLPGVPEPGKISVRGRARYLKDQAKLTLTSSEGHNHLLTFGEFAATYLLAWNPDLWPEPWNRSIRVDPQDKPKGFQPMLSEQITKLNEARRGSGAARRVLANIPTYMIFDDHEVTDDWNLTPEWTKTFHANATGRRIVLNALCAYWAFQAWGNTPQAFDLGSFVNPVTDYCRTGKNEAAAEKALFEFKEWSYVAPTDPPVLMLNTRTRRAATRGALDYRVDLGRTEGYFYPRNTRAPRLLDPDERARLAGLLKSLSGTGTAIVVTPGPVFGVDAIEGAIEAIAAVAGEATTDLESWRPNPLSFVDLMRLLAGAGLSTVAILSGDVHYAFQVAARLTQAGQTIRIGQFTSSALKNMPTGMLGAASVFLGGRVDLRQAWHWWLPSGDEGPVTRIPATATGELTKAKERFRRDPDLIEQITYLAHMSNKQVVLQHSNVGELTVTGGRLTHRHWAQARGQTQGLPQVTLDPGSWPA
ncbi:hypothetical protein Rhe02_33380 [Rhizocola hellebori]|uniref:PhoD-like phosphatase metallophosphatase domain-containing protein n=1 Tax=Rhizocola hellebori TaxID=1392758 RepID=A0A8J3Q8S4_9ACTN|nr:hypothetical protein [Rhizocola hellebori]GIH05271.1 hypothetical protein Rhe02_33380 [Rhizocola hellebori]